MTFLHVINKKRNDVYRGKNQNRHCRRYYHTRRRFIVRREIMRTYRRVIRSGTFADRRLLQGPFTSRRRQGPMVANRRGRLKKKHEKHDDIGIVVVESRG